MSVSSRLKEYCFDKKITQKMLVLRGYASAQTVNNYINGNTEPRADFLEKFIKEFRVSAIWLMTGENDKYYSETNVGVNIANDIPTSPIYKTCTNPECMERIAELIRDKANLEHLNQLLDQENKRLKEGGPPGAEHPKGGVAKQQRTGTE